MLELTGGRFDCCDGLSRRNFVKVGFLGLAGMSLPEVLRARAAAAETPRRTAVIYIELAGGPSHFETYDPKPTAPAEYRGPLGIVKTRVPGIEFSALMAEQAKIADKLAVVRSIAHNSGSHQTSAHLVQTGYYLRDRQNTENEMPCTGSIASRVRGANTEGLPAFVSLPRRMRYGSAAYLGKGHNPFETISDPNKSNFQVANLTLVKNLDLERLGDRRALLTSLDAARRVVDTRGVTQALDEFSAQAFEMVTGDRAREAFDIAAEPEKVRKAYGRNATGQSLLLARRLVEAGVTFVTIRVGGWDDHQKIADRMKQKGPDYDRGVAALVRDLCDRGLDRDVLVVAMGEFGRTPRVNKTAGRDHWGAAMSVLLAGGGLKMGQVVGATNSKGETPVDRPYRPEHVLAVVYRHLGIDPQATFDDFSGRPRYVLEDAELIDELV